MPQKDKHLDWIDGLKGISACIIAFAWHYQHFIAFPNVPFYKIFQVTYSYGSYLVELFFMLSGFGMMLGYGERILNHEITFIRYMKKRIKKIYPLFLLSTFVVIILEMLIHHQSGEYFVYQNFDLYHLILNLLLLQNGVIETKYSFNAPSWVISVLIFLYVIFFLVCYYAKDISMINYLFMSGVILGIIIFITGGSRPFWNSQIGRGLSCFSLGVLLYTVYQQRDKYKLNKIGYAGILFIALVYFLLRTDRMDYIGKYRMVVILAVSPLLIICAFSIPWIGYLLSVKPLVFLGKISIAIYLFHFPVQCFLKCISLYGMDLIFSSPVFQAVYIVLTLGAASIYSFFISDKYERWLCGTFSLIR